ncbi:MAG: response regulator [Acidimicrobiia bacterium]|nr:response regulator [Acidimicrobiia bacterium]
MADELILVVEDNERNAKLVRDVLDATGYRLLETTTAEEGLEMARRDQPDLILMDIQLPGMDGTTALGHLKADPATSAIPVIAVTASVMPMERAQVMEAGFDGFQEKPISVKALLGQIRELLNGA